MKNSLTLSTHLLSVRLQILKYSASNSILRFNMKILKSLIILDKGDAPEFIKKIILIPAKWLYGGNN